MTGLISVIVTTYNRPDALAACLQSLAAQTDKGFEIIVADDGSGPATQALLAELAKRSETSIRHVHHEDLGFRAAAIRNRAVAVSRGDYLLFLDGDCLVFPHFIQRHRSLAETGYFVPGNRLLLNESYTRQVLEQRFPLYSQPLVFFIRQRIKGTINRLLPLLYLPWQFQRYWAKQNWQKAMTCNLGVWKQDFLAINGFDETFSGWGYEDSDLVVRLLHYGSLRKEGRFAVPVMHLWHRQNDRSRHDHNYQRLLERVADTSVVRSMSGVERYL